MPNQDFHAILSTQTPKVCIIDLNPLKPPERQLFYILLGSRQAGLDRLTGV